MSPTQLSLRYLRAAGWYCVIVEHWNPHAKVRNDLFGWADILALRDTDTLAVQTTSVTNVSSRVRKINESDTVALVRAAGWQIHVHGWRAAVLARNVDLTIEPLETT